MIQFTFQKSVREIRLHPLEILQIWAWQMRFRKAVATDWRRIRAHSHWADCWRRPASTEQMGSKRWRWSRQSWRKPSLCDGRATWVTPWATWWAGRGPTSASHANGTELAPRCVT